MVDFDVSSTVYGVPKSHWECSLKNFRFPHEGARADLDDYLESLNERIEYREENGRMPNEPPTNVLMTGPTGVGKTHLSVGIYRWAVLRADLSDVRFVEVPKFCRQVRKGFDSGEDPFEKVEDVEVLLVLDDLFGEDLKPYDKNHILPRLITDAYRNKASIVSTTNLNKEEVSKKFHPHQMSRLLQNGVTWNFTGEDERLNK